MTHPKEISIFWFRRDLRFFDNHGFWQALNSPWPVFPIFIFDPNILDDLEQKKDARVAFIHQQLEHLNQKFQQFGSNLNTFFDTPEQVFERLSKEFTLKAIYTNTDYEPYAIERDVAIAQFAKSRGIGFKSFKDQVIFEKSEVMKSDGSPYTIFTPYSKIWKLKLRSEGIPEFPSELLLKNLFPSPSHSILSLVQIGFESVNLTFPSSSLNVNVIKHYEATRNLPAVEGTSGQSIHLRFGTVSIRKWVQKAQQYNEQWLNELIWREFFMMILYHFPQVVTRSFKPKYDSIQWRNNEAEFELWCKGETGFPMVDAGMRELNATGLMHNRVRMVVASFLCKHLLIDWRWGEKYFAEKLLDFDLSANNGNWQWAAGSGCDAAPYFRVFNPNEQAKRFDPKAQYLRRWIPEWESLDYAKPMVEHAFARDRALKVYKKAMTDFS